MKLQIESDAEALAAVEACLKHLEAKCLTFGSDRHTAADCLKDAAHHLRRVLGVRKVAEIGKDVPHA